MKASPKKTLAESSPIKEPETEVSPKKKLILVAVKSPKQCLDVQKFLVAKYVKRNHRVFYEEKFRFILNSHREFNRR